MNKKLKIADTVDRIQQELENGLEFDQEWSKNKEFLVELKKVKIMEWKDYLRISIPLFIFLFGFFLIKTGVMITTSDKKYLSFMPMAIWIASIMIVFLLFMSLYMYDRRNTYPYIQRSSLIKKISEDIKKIEREYYEKLLSEESCSIYAINIFNDLIKKKGAPKDMSLHILEYLEKKLKRFEFRDPYPKRVPKHKT